MNPSTRWLPVFLLCAIAPLLAHGSPSVTPPSEKSPVTATWLSVAGFAAPFVLAGFGRKIEDDTNRYRVNGAAAALAVFAPVAGHMYADSKFLTKGLALRLGGTLMGFVGLSTLYSGESHSANSAALLLMVAGTGLFFVGGIHDVGTAGRRATQANERRRAAQGMQWGVAPVVGRSRSGHMSGGLSLGARF